MAPLTVTMLLHVMAEPYRAQSADVLQCTKQMLAPALLCTHQVAMGVFGQSVFTLHEVVHQPCPIEVMQYPDVHSAFVVHGAPSGRFMHALAGEQTCCP